MSTPPALAAAALAAATAGRSRRLLICYLPVGDPAAAPATSQLYLDNGVDVIEAGIAVPDPVLDGPEVRESMARAIGAGMDARAAAGHLAADLDAAGNPAAVWMSYRSRPDDDYLALVASAGVGGVLLPDADPAELAARAGRHGLLQIPFLRHAPAPAEVTAARTAGGYVMLAAADGVTGVRPGVDEANREIMAGIRARGVGAPIALGFGISTPEQARAAAGLGADGVVIGSACVRAARRGAAELTALLRDVRRALDD